MVTRSTVLRPEGHSSLPRTNSDASQRNRMTAAHGIRQYLLMSHLPSLPSSYKGKDTLGEASRRSIFHFALQIGDKATTLSCTSNYVLPCQRTWIETCRLCLAPARLRSSSPDTLNKEAAIAPFRQIHFCGTIHGSRGYVLPVKLNTTIQAMTIRRLMVPYSVRSVMIPESFYG